MSNKMVAGRFVRPHSEILAVVSRLTDLASASSSILENVDEKDAWHWQDSANDVVNWIFTAHLLMDAAYGDESVNRRWLLGAGESEIVKFLDGEETWLDELWDEI
jgi:hypothetical protein